MKLRRFILWVLVVSISGLMLVSCKSEEKREPSPAIPKEEEREEPEPEGEGEGEEKEEGALEEEEQAPDMPGALQGQEGEEPRLNVYIHQTEEVAQMPFEEYVEGVVAGEIKNDWPAETIKAQAIIARTFVLDFIETKGESRHNPDAHVSTDIEEAQAWNVEEVNEAIKEAVKETRGQVLTYNGQFTKTWFHSNAGGITADAKEGLNFKEENPPYIESVESPDIGEEVPEDERVWTATFPKERIIEALGEMGSGIEDFDSVTIGDKGPSGRTTTLNFGDTSISAADFRVALDSTEMKSTLLDSIEYVDDELTITGRGYGHGVGMSQWGAYFMAQEGKTFEEILTHYFKDVKIAKMWD